MTKRLELPQSDRLPVIDVHAHSPGDLEALSQEGIFLRRAGDFKAAESTHRSVVVAAPTNPYFKYRLAEVLFDQNPASEEALQLVLESARLDPRFPLFRETAVRELFRLLPPRKALDEYLAMDAATRSETSLAHRASGHQLASILLIEADEAGLAWEGLRGAFGDRALSFGFSEKISGRESVILKYSRGGYDLIVPADFWRARFLLERLFALFPAFDRIAAVGEFRISIGDRPEGNDAQLCFSSCSDVHVPVPDAVFFREFAYAPFREAASAAPSWRQRKVQAYWRGSLTGAAPDLKGIMQLPRVDLCLAGRFSPFLDAKITDLSQYASFGEPLLESLKGLEIWGEREPVTTNLQYRYCVDVDGNSNAWQSMFMKLLSGACVIKVKSPWRQWYYDRLAHAKNVYFVNRATEVPVAVEHLELNTRHAERIAASGRDLGISMSLETETARFASIAEQFLAKL